MPREPLQLTEHPSIEGWGADLNPEDRPAVPKERTPPRYINAHWSEPERQIPQVKIFHSTERPSLTPVFGSSTPPRGLSGKIRALAYRLSENDLRHWLMLLFADRVDMVEGVLMDLMRGKIPNLFAETGLKAELKYNKRGFLGKALAGGVFLGVLALFWEGRKAKQARLP